MKHFALDDAEVVESGNQTYEAVIQPRGWIAPEWLSYGLYVAAAAKKAGKSGLFYHVMMCICTGVTPFTGEEREPGDCLFIDWENGNEVNNYRQHEMFPGGNRPDLDRLTTVYNSKRFPGLFDRLEAWRQSVERPTMVLIDIMRKVMPLTRSRLMAPDRDDQVLIPLHRWANEHRICVVMLSHQRLGPIDTDDIMASISGSSAMSGTPDAGVVMTRRRNVIELHATGRNLPTDQHLAIVKENGWYRLMGDIEQAASANSHRAILEALSEHGQMSRFDIRQLTDIKDQTLGKALWDMKKKGLILAHGIGKATTYTVVGKNGIDGNENTEKPEKPDLSTVTETVTPIVTETVVTEVSVTGNGAVTEPVTISSPSDTKENIPTVTDLAYFSTLPNGYVLRWMQRGKKQATYSEIRMGCHPTLDADQVTEAVDALVADGCLEIVATGPKGGNTYTLTKQGKCTIIDADPNQVSLF